MHVPLGFSRVSIRPGDRAKLYAKVGCPGFFLGERLVVIATREQGFWARLRTWFMMKLGMWRLFHRVTVVKPPKSRPALLVRSLRAKGEECLTAPLSSELFAEHAVGTGRVAMRPCGEGDPVEIEIENVDKAPWWKPWQKHALAHVQVVLFGRVEPGSTVH